MNSPVEKIKERLSIVDVISSYLSIEPSGKNFKARCPFHNEKTPSFFISTDRSSYYCFGCGAKGDIFSFVERFEGIDFMGALKLLAERAGITLETRPKEFNNKEKEKKELYYEILEEATKFFETNFDKEPSVRAYLISRGLTDATIKNFRIGFVFDEWRSLYDYLVAKGYKIIDLEIVGLVKKSEKSAYDRFRGRIIFPINDSSGRVIAFSGRIFGKSDSKEAKYLNSPDTPLFNKSNVLFGIDKAKTAIRTRGYSIVVEGQMDLILSHQALFTNTVAVSGTALTDTITDNSLKQIDNENKINNLGLIHRLSPNIIFAYDGDDAGIRAASRSALIALSLDMQVKIAVLPLGKDPADIILEDPSLWKAYIKDAVNIISFHVDKICQGTSDMRIRGRKIKEIVFPFLSMVKSAIERSAYITYINQKTGLSERAIIEDFEIYDKTQGLHQYNSISTENNIILKNDSRRNYLENRLFGIIFWQENMGEGFVNIKELCNSFNDRIGEGVYKDMLDAHKPFYESLAIETEMWYGSKTDTLCLDTKEILLNLEEEILNEQKDSLKPLDNEEKITKFSILLKRIEEIKQARFL